MAILETLIEKVKKTPKKLVLAEGHDPRVVTAANKILEMGIARSIVVLGTEEEITKSCSVAKITDRKFATINQHTSSKLEVFADEFCKIRAQKGKTLTLSNSLDTMKNRLFFGAMMVRLGDVDGMVAGSIASTADMLKAAFMVVGTAPGIKTGSSCFIMDLAKPSPAGDKTLLYADCAVIPDPNAETLVDIAMATVQTHNALIGNQPKVAFLSFSTKGSASHPILDKIVKATELMKKKIKESNLDIIVDGELQADSAIVPKVAAQKCSNSPLKGSANILIFPDLNVGNICYKLTQRLAGAEALGPILQGLAKPINDLSRGCSADDILGVAAITACQAAGSLK